MKIAHSWILLSAILSITLVLLAPRALPVDGRLAEGLQLDSELQLLEELLQQETVSRELLQNRYNDLHRILKPSVIRAQIEGIPKLFILLSLLGLNSINILVAIGLLLGKPNNTIASETKLDSSKSNHQIIPQTPYKLCFYYLYLAFALTTLTAVFLLVLGYTFFGGIVIAGSLVLLAFAIVKTRHIFR
ncbi:MAG: hypothetical protein B6D78_13605 [gamma proteobacterium symbiont of Ctena orbiculata]|nr:MAG: hypothetical protein B6D78_13605 [gamma proteobacterium symbiont of Ctena orbiculata]